MARRRIISLLMPLPTFYNPDTEGVRKPIERWKFTRTAEEISRHFGAGAELQVFRRDRPQGFWWDRGLLSKDVLAYISADLPDTEETRTWMQTYSEDATHRALSPGRNLSAVACHGNRARATCRTRDPKRGGVRCRAGN